MQGVGPPEGGSCRTQGQLDTDVTDPGNSDSAATSRRPPGLGFLGCRGLKGQGTQGQSRGFIQSVLSWESLECSIPQSQVQCLVRHLLKSPSEPGGTCCKGKNGKAKQKPCTNSVSKGKHTEKEGDTAPHSVNWRTFSALVVPYWHPLLLSSHILWV